MSVNRPGISGSNSAPHCQHIQSSQDGQLMYCPQSGQVVGMSSRPRNCFVLFLMGTAYRLLLDWQHPMDKYHLLWRLRLATIVKQSLMLWRDARSLPAYPVVARSSWW